MFVVCAGRGTIIGIGLALVSPIGIAASGEDMGMMGQPIEQSGGKLFVGKDLDPLGERRIGSDDCGTPLVTLSQQIKQQLSGGARLLTNRCHTSGVAPGIATGGVCFEPKSRFFGIKSSFDLFMAKSHVTTLPV